MLSKIPVAALAALLVFLTFVDTHAGSIFGEVRFADAPPKLPSIKVSKDQDYCGETLPNETYLTVPNGGLKNVVVYIESAPVGKAADPLKENFLYNDGCRYNPHVMAFHLGEKLKVKNNIQAHIPHGYLGERTVFTYPYRSRTPSSKPRHE